MKKPELNDPQTLVNVHLSAEFMQNNNQLLATAQVERNENTPPATVVADILIGLTTQRRPKGITAYYQLPTDEIPLCQISDNNYVLNDMPLQVTVTARVSVNGSYLYFNQDFLLQ